jgi:hypothetical protein
METNRRYTLMAFPQGFDGNKLKLNILFIPVNRNPLKPVDFPVTFIPTGETTPFAKVKPEFEVKIVKGLDDFPVSNATAGPRIPIPVSLLLKKEDGNKEDLLKGIGEQYKTKLNLNHVSDKAEKVKQPDQSVAKYLPHSYRDAFNFTTSRHPNARTDDSYHCAFRKDKPPVPVPPNEDVSWGQLFAHILRQPLLARACGLIYETELDIQPGWFDKGGYIYVDLVKPNEYQSLQNATLGDTGGAFIKRYAARIPVLKIGEPRTLFAPLLFPVIHQTAASTPLKGEWDKIFAETSSYDDGFAKIVHANQPVSSNLLAESQDGFHPVKDAGIRLAWDDEQILIWYYRQLTENPSDPGSKERVDAPLGVSGYRIDVKLEDDKWGSLNTVKAKNIAHAWEINGADTRIIKGKQIELPYQVYPTQIDGDPNSLYWLPMYYTNWIGRSLVLKNSDAIKIYHQDLNNEKDAFGKPRQVSPDQIYEEIPPSTDLRYGNEYTFRVRLADLTGGGPGQSDNFPEVIPSQEATWKFLRYIAPATLRLDVPKMLVNHSVEYYNAVLNEDSGKIEYNANPAIVAKRPLLSYPAVVFTGEYQKKGKDPVELLIKAADQLIAESVAAGGTPAKPARAFVDGIADPDVVKVEVVVEVESLGLDNLLSRDGKENYIPLYTTTRKFPDTFEDAVTVPVKFVDCPVLNFNNSSDPLNNSSFTKVIIDGMESIILPTARKVRVTVRALCEDKAGYFGFKNEGNHDLDSRYGKETRLLFYKESHDEKGLLSGKENIPVLQGIYLQPDPVIQWDGKIASALLRRENNARMPDIVQRLATQLDVECKGMTLVGKKGERVVFACSSRIRHSLAPDNSSVTFASRDDLINHWLGGFVYRMNRDWTWNGLKNISFTIDRRKKFRKDKAAETEILRSVGEIEVKRTVSFEALQPDTYGKIDRSGTTIIYIDAIEPKTSLKTGGGKLRFPDELELEYILNPCLKENHGSVHDAPEKEKLNLPTTINPWQVPKLVSAGFALSPYQPDDTYSSTGVRQRYLWLEFAEPVENPDDTLFCRILAYAPDQLISNNHPSLLAAPVEPALQIDPEYIRTVIENQSDDMAGLGAMQVMENADDSHVHYLLPIPPGMHPDSPELFGFFTCEFRIGHGHWPDRTDNLWSTAQGRYGRPLRVTGIQYPAPTLVCAVARDEEKIYVNAPYAKAVMNGKNMTADPPRTQLWCLLYAQVKRADNAAWRNILLDERQLDWQHKLTMDKNEMLKFKELLKTHYSMPSKVINKPKSFKLTDEKLLQGAALAMFRDKPKTGLALWYNEEISILLSNYGLPSDASLSVVVVEVFTPITSLREHISGLYHENVGLELMSAHRHFKGGTDPKVAATIRGKADEDPTEVINSAATWQMQMERPDQDPLGSNLGKFRILRTSPLTPVPDACCKDCTSYTMNK